MNMTEEFHCLNWITEINWLFHDILIYWDVRGQFYRQWDVQDACWEISKAAADIYSFKKCNIHFQIFPLCFFPLCLTLYNVYYVVFVVFYIQKNLIMSGL